MSDKIKDYQFLFKQEIGKTILKSACPLLLEEDLTQEFISEQFDPKMHQTYLNEDPKVGNNVSSKFKNAITNLIKAFWSIFNKDNVKISIKSYQCLINKADHLPIVERRSKSCKKQSTPF